MKNDPCFLILIELERASRHLRTAQTYCGPADRETVTAAVAHASAMRAARDYIAATLSIGPVYSDERIAEALDSDDQHDRTEADHAAATTEGRREREQEANAAELPAPGSPW